VVALGVANGASPFLLVEIAGQVEADAANLDRAAEWR
jgi:hypothetical protein